MTRQRPGRLQHNPRRRVREVLERHRDLYVEPKKKRTASKFTFAELGENEDTSPSGTPGTRRCVG